MTGFGRTGKWFAYQHFDITPDIVVCAKGMGGGYFPVGGVLVKEAIYRTIAEESGGFYAGFTWGANPMAAAIIAKTIDYIKKHNLIERCSRMGEYLGQKLVSLSAHPTVGDIRGAGLMWGIEFVEDAQSKQPFNPDLAFSRRVKDKALELGLYLEASEGCDRGNAGDMIMIGPPFIVTEDQIDEIVSLLDQAITAVENETSQIQMQGALI
jgi:adenosylmethionine-8-amino-7-oxononanoate aminotransferase